MDKSDLTPLTQHIEQGTGLCVKCGKCLSVCPTYQVSHNEAESPRGRISLMQGLISGQLPVSPSLEHHLDQCLACRHCERVCPAHVPYGQLIDETRALQNQHKGPTASRKLPGWLLFFVQHQQQRFLLQSLLRVFFKLGGMTIAKPLSKVYGLKTLLAPLSLLSSPIKFTNALPTTLAEEKVMIFSSCVSECLDFNTLHAAKEICHRLDCEVIEPAIECCGALFQHNGYLDKAQQKTNQAIQACTRFQSQTLLTLASGCGTQIKDALERQEESAFKLNVIDICHWLAQHPKFKDIALRALPEEIWVHQPCTLTNGMGTPSSTWQLLQCIPNIRIQPLPTLGCCGASGLHLLNNPQFSKQFLALLDKALTRDKPYLVVSSNIGCAMHLQRFFIENNFSIPVVHPVTLIWQQMQEKNFIKI